MIKYVKGDATNPQVQDGYRIIIHGCNDMGKWGAGFTKALDSRWSEPRERYIKWSVSPNSGFEAGNIQVVSVGPSLYVVNMITQNGIRSGANPRPINYEALFKCLIRVREWVRAFVKAKSLLMAPTEPLAVSIHMPRVGCGLAGGKWSIVGELVNVAFDGTDVYIYDLEW